MTGYTPAVVGVPVTVPVEPAMDSPGGRPEADHEAMVAVDDESVAELVSPAMAVPVTLLWPEWAVTETVLVIVQVNAAVPLKLLPSVAVRTTEEEPAVVGVPVMVPLEPLIDRPTGSPVADQVSVAPDWVSVAEFVRPAIAVPDTSDWLPGLVTVTVLVIVQENDVEPE